MSQKNYEQFESSLSIVFDTKYPDQRPSFRRRGRGERYWAKRYRNRRERRRAKLNPNCEPLYKKYIGYEY